ncbi:hypothetical protein HMPREF9727_01615 [Treponema denticola MYR-T]|jgi:hypothetical protein|uniref:DUF3996 domain-containing protein n=1 Tax=Treponema denticola H1-T TaxID=999431 RepID=M2C654_TREDN|nr:MULTISPECIES: hypothetical protein [Treponema]AIN94695.1 hypothetical protein JO40_11895 [Treponema putidum]EGC77242.1 hypothetical protein HMPREF9353_01592 [Treponema denticola F0402]EMB28356.1 hypothetical protein HMPREF9727_01615 [Treponema denticola MYR-T]EMB29098.1 hypothetical protein HMPREF9725_01968 [Treponema denticola H1-T]TWI77563.1 hypothetical protein JM98_01257 [Treponema putidum]
MKKIFFLSICLFLSVLTFIHAEQENRDVTGLALEYGLIGRQSDFGISLAITSPWLFHNAFALHLNADCFFPNSQRRTPYYVLDFSVLGGSLMQTANIRVYGGGGPILIFPVQKNKPKVLVTGQGFFGFEFFMGKSPAGLSFFIEMGGGGFGFTAKTGLRYTFPMLYREK